jgi:hypothetical protein
MYIEAEDALDVTYDFSSDSDLDASVDDDEEDWEDSYERMVQEEHFQPGQPSTGIVVVSPTDLDISLEVLGSAVRRGERVTRYLIRIEAESTDDR